MVYTLRFIHNLGNNGNAFTVNIDYYAVEVVTTYTSSRTNKQVAETAIDSDIGFYTPYR